jgi:phosphate acetyltransferase
VENKTLSDFHKFLIEQVRRRRINVVLPEADEPRVLQAAARILSLDLIDLTLLGEREQILTLGKTLALDLSAAKFISFHNADYLEPFTDTYYQLRQAKGITRELAAQTVQKASYFGTMLVYLDYVQAMVSGAVHTTLNTIKPSFEIIKMAPGVSMVSSCCFICLDSGLLVYADCAVNPQPDANQLAEIAVSTARTAQRFGLDPKVALLSYSSGTSGKGPLIDLVREASQKAQQMAPELAIDGPMQYDAAVDETVAELKMPTSPVAGHANTFIFPDLNSGNIVYKAVQRASGAVAIGPVLQGLNKPVNDLSRGATVDDIVFTILITAVQAQNFSAPVQP